MLENRRHARLSEDRRILISSVTVFAGTATLIALVVIPSGLRTLPLALWLLMLGILGAMICLKLYERAQFHERRARHLRARLIELTPTSGAEEAQREAEAAHAGDRPWLSSIHLNAFLVALNVVAALIGLLYTLLAFVRGV